jgi:hypothetical protein
MDLDVRYHTHGFTLVIFNSEYIDKKEFIVLNIPILTPLIKAAIYKVLGASVHSITNPRNILHHPLPARNFVLSQNSLASTLQDQYGVFDVIGIIDGIKQVIKQGSCMESNVRSKIIPHVEEQSRKIEKLLTEDLGSRWTDDLENMLGGLKGRFIGSKRSDSVDNVLSTSASSTSLSLSAESDICC